MKRAKSSYNYNYKVLNLRKIKSNYNKNTENLENVNPIQIKSKKLKSLNFNYLKERKYKVPKQKINQTNIFKKISEENRLYLKEKSNKTLLDAIKIQSGFNNFLNLVGTTKAKDKVNRMVSASTFCDFSDKNSIRIIDNKERTKSSDTNIANKKRNFSSNFNFKKNGYNDVSNMVKSYLMKLNKKNLDSLINNENENDDILSQTLSPKTEKKVYYNININLGTMVNNKQSNKESGKDDDSNDNDFIKYLQEKKNNNYECNNPEIVKKRTDYIIKFAKINEILKKLNLAADCFRINFRDIFNSSLKSLIKYFDKCNNFLMNDVKFDEKNMNLWMTNLKRVYDFCNEASKIQKLFYDELHFLKNENLMLKRKLLSQETDLSTKEKEINEINKLIIKYDLNSKIKIGKMQQLYLKNIKHKFTSQESQYVMTIRRLRQEIKSLTEILEKNKPDLETIEKLKDKIKNIDSKYENEIDKLNKINGTKNISIQLLSQRESSLNEQISELQNEITNLKNRENNEQEKNVVLNAKIENLNRLNGDKNKIIEELKNNIELIKQKDIDKKNNNQIANIILMSPK